MLKISLKISFSIKFYVLLSSVKCRNEFKGKVTVAFANSLDPDQDGQNVGPDLIQNCLALLIVFL